MKANGMAKQEPHQQRWGRKVRGQKVQNCENLRHGNWYTLLRSQNA